MVQIEAALSRMPGAGGRVSLQSRLDEVRSQSSLNYAHRVIVSVALM